MTASRTYAVADGVAGDYLETTYDYDALGRLVKTTSPSGAFSKTAYDGYYDRVLATYVGTDEGTTVNATNVTDDVIVTETVPHYDSLGRVDLVTSYARADGSTKLGDLAAGNWSYADSRRTFSASWFDELSRTIATADYGTNAGVDLAASWPLTAPTSGSDDAIIVRYAYDGFGRYDVVYDNADIATRTFYDDAGRQIFVVKTDVPTYSARADGGLSPC